MNSDAPAEIPAETALGGGLVLVLLLAGLVGWVIVLKWSRQHRIDLALDAGALPGRQWGGEDVLVAGVCISSLLVVYAAVGLWMRQRGFDEHWFHIVAVLQNTVLHLTVAGVLIARMGVSWASLRQRFGIPATRSLSSWFGQSFLGYILVFPFVFAFALISQFLVSVQGGRHMFQPVLTLFMGEQTPLWFQGWIVLVAVVSAPVVEEMFFRGVMLPVLVRKYSVWSGVILCSLFFALVHGHMQSFLPLFVLSMGLGAAYIKTGNLLVPIGMHALFNAVSLTGLILSSQAS
jgi:membrane protease YdiL (CAAX protease family)